MNATPTNSQSQSDVNSAPEQAEETSQGESLEAQLQQAQTERQSHLDSWMRTQAEFENYRKRVNKELEQDQKYRAMAVVRDLLPALDNLHRALRSASGGGGLEQLVQGVQMVTQQFDDALARHSIVPIPAEGRPFDPNLHEALQQVPDPNHPPMTVLQEVERGYMLHDRVVRPSKVIVSSAPLAAEQS